MRANFEHYRDNFNLRFNQYLLFVGALLLVFYIVLIFTLKKPSLIEIINRFLPALGIIALGYAFIFFIQVPLYKKWTEDYISGLRPVQLSIDELKYHKVKERANTFAMLNFYVPEYVVSFYNNQYQCNIELISIRKAPPFLNDDISSWEGKSITAFVQPDILSSRHGSDRAVKVFNFKGIGYNLDESFFTSASEYVSTLPRNIVFYIFSVILVLIIYLSAIWVFVR